MKLEINQSQVLKIDPSEEWTDTEIDIAPGEKYIFTTTGTWFDFYIPCSANGYPGKLLVRDETKKRVPHQNLCALMGALDYNEAGSFLIGVSLEKTFLSEGRLFCFANDVRGNFFRRNNWGSVRLEIKRAA